MIDYINVERLALQSPTLGGNQLFFWLKQLDLGLKSIAASYLGAISLLQQGLSALQKHYDREIQYIAQSQKDCQRYRRIVIAKFSRLRNYRRNVGDAEGLRSLNSVCYAVTEGMWAVPKDCTSQLQIRESGGDDAIAAAKLLYFIFTIDHRAN